MARAVGYRAGTAYVTVVPEFGDAQKVIARKFNEMIKNGVSDKDIEDQIAKRIEKGIREGSKRGTDAAKKDLADVGDVAVKEAADAGKEIEDERIKAAERERKRQIRDADLYKKTMRKAIKEHGKELDAIHNRFGRRTLRGRNGLAAPFHEARRAVEALNKELDKGLSGDSRVLEKQYKNLTDSIERMKKVARNPGDMQSLKRMSEETAKYRDIIEGRMTPQESQKAAQELKEHNDRMARVEREAQAEREAAALRRRQADRKDRMLRYQEAERARKQGLREIAEAADASNRARVGSVGNVGEGRDGQNARQARLIERHRRASERLNTSINETMANLSRLASRRVSVNLVTASAMSNLRILESRMESFARYDLDKDVDVNLNEAEFTAEVRRMEYLLDSIPDESVTMDLNDEQAQARLRQFRANLESIRDRVNVKMSVTGLNEARADMLRLQQQAESIRGNVDFEIGDEEAHVAIKRLEIALDNIKDKKVGVDLRESEARAQIAEIDAMLEILDRKKINIPIDLDVRKSMIDQIREFNAQVDRTDLRMRTLNKSIKNAAISLTETTQAFRIFSPILTAVVFGGAPLVNLLGGITAGLGAVTSLIPGAVGGFSVLGFAFGGLSDAAKKYEDAQEALAVKADERTKAQEKHIAAWREETDEIGKATVSFIEYTDELKGQLAGVQMAAREGLFPGVESSLRTILDVYAEPFSDFMFKMGEGFGTFADHWSKLITSPSAQEWFGRVARDANVYSGHLLIAGENFAAGLAHVVDAFRPATRSLMTWIVDVSEGFRGWADDLTINDTFLEFMGTVRRTMPMINQLFGNVSELFIKLSIAVEPFTEAVLGALNSGLEFLNAMDPKVLGAIVGAVGGLAGGLMILSGVMAGVGAAAAILNAATGSIFTTVAMGLGLFIATSTTALGASTALGEEVGILGGSALELGSALGIVSGNSSAVLGFFGDLITALEPLTPVIVDLVTDILELSSGAIQGLITVLHPVVDIIGSLVSWFAGLDDSTQKIIATVLTGTAIWAKYGDTLGIIIGATVDMVQLYGSVAIEMGKAAASGGGLSGVFEATGLSADVASKKSGALLGTLKGFAGIAGAALGVIAMTKAVEGFNEITLPAIEGVDAFDASVKGMSLSAEDAKGALDALFSSKDGGGLGSMSDSWLGREKVDDFSSAMDRMAERTGGVMGPLREFNAEIKTVFGLFGDTEWDAIRGQLEGVDESFAKLVSTDFEGVTSGFREMSDGMEDAGISTELILKHFDDYRQELENTATQLGVNKLTDEEYYEWMRGNVPDAINKAVEAHGRQQDGLAGVHDETADAEQATRDLIAASDELAGRYLNQEEANLRYAEKMDEVTAAVKNGATGMDINTEAGRENRRMLLDAADAARSKADADLEATGDAKAFGDQLWADRERISSWAQEMGLAEDEADELANTALGIPLERKTKTQILNYAGTVADAKGIKAEIDKLKDVDLTVNITPHDPYGLLKTGPGKSPGPWAPGAGGLIPHHDGGVIEPMADGGLRSMKPIAQMVQPNTWRVVGDRMDVDEAYIPLDGSARSKSILLETMLRMPGMFMAKGGILGFAAGGVATPGASAEGATDATMAPVSEAFAALEAALREGFTSLLADMLGAAQAFFAELLARSLEFNDSMLVQDAAWRAAEAQATQDHLAASTATWAAHRASLTAAAEGFRSSETAAEAAYLSTLLASTQAAQGNLRSLWQTTYADLASRGASYRSSETTQFSGFYSGLMSQMSAFGSNARTEWGRIWTDLVNSSASIFGRLPGEVASILVDTSKKLNTHIVDPFNKVIKDFDIKKVPQLGKFPTQGLHTGGHVKLATGGFMPGYTPGRDVHTFVSPTGGVLELSGGEPVLRPEAGKVLGRGWVDGVNMAARTGGVRGVQKFLSAGGQAFSTGGVWNNLWGIIHEQFPGARLTSAKRNGTGGSYHNTGRAIDIAGPERMDKAYMMRMFNFIHDNYGNSAEVIYTPATGRNILNGRYHEYSPAVKADHHDHVHWANRVRFSGINGPPTGESAMGLFDIEGSMKGWVEAARKEVMDGFLPDVTMGVAGNMFSALAKQKKDAFVTDHAHLINDPGGPGGGVGRWRPMVNAALDHVGQSTSEAMQNIVLRRMNQESGGNPRAINLWDINARRGTPSKGLMQVIDPTFQAYRDRSLVNDIWDPMANIVASMRYALARYGSLPAAYNRKGGYAEGTSGIDLSDILGDMSVKPLLRDNGGRLPRGLSVIQNNLPHDETVVPYSPEQIAKILDGGPGAGGGVDMSTHFHGDLRGNPREIMEQTERIKRVAAIQRPIKF